MLNTKTASIVTTDNWEEIRSAEKVKMKRLTIDIPEESHRQIKSSCSEKGIKIADEIRVLYVMA